MIKHKMILLLLVCIIGISFAAPIYMLAADAKRVTIDPNIIPYPNYVHDPEDYLLPLWPDDPNCTRGFTLPLGIWIRPKALAVHPWPGYHVDNVRCVYAELNGSEFTPYPSVTWDPNDIYWSTTIDVEPGLGWAGYRMTTSNGDPSTKKEVDYRLVWYGEEDPGGTLR
jgi:hypothetical protein